MLKRLLLTTLLTLALASACTRTASDSPPTEPPLNFPSPAPGTTPLCQPGDLGTSSNSIGASDALTLGITLTNKSKNPCAFSNPPQATLSNSSGQPLEVQVSNPTNDQTPTPSQVTVAPGESVIVSLVWSNYCQPLPKDGLAIHLELSTGQAVDIPTKLASEPGCDAKNQPSKLLVAPYSYPP